MFFNTIYCSVMDLILFCNRDFKKYMVVVGYKRGTNAYRLWIIEGEKIFFRRKTCRIFSKIVKLCKFKRNDFYSITKSEELK